MKTVRKRSSVLTARTADRFFLYEQSVQAPEAEVAFIDRAYRLRHGRPPLSLREDFCGTAWLCAEWVKSRRDRTAVGRDLDQPTLDYGQRQHVDTLANDGAQRVRLCRRNVLAVSEEQVDAVAAFNFSYCIFKTRAVLLRYFASVRHTLAKGGAFVLDIYGGIDAQRELVESKRVKGATYVWDQRPYDAVSGEAMRYIHFRFDDNTELKRAFAYDWRIWSLPELRDMLSEAGFSGVDVYWEGSDTKGRGNGIFRKVRAAKNEQAWIAYVVAWR